MVMPNLYGTIVNNVCSGITGGIGMTPSCDIGENFKVNKNLFFII
jgi:isocitrate dehydrogenase (NAD+)